MARSFTAATAITLATVLLASMVPTGAHAQAPRPNPTKSGINLQSIKSLAGPVTSLTGSSSLGYASRGTANKVITLDPNTLLESSLTGNGKGTFISYLAGQSRIYSSGLGQLWYHTGSGWTTQIGDGASGACAMSGSATTIPLGDAELGKALIKGTSTIYVAVTGCNAIVSVALPSYDSPTVVAGTLNTANHDATHITAPKDMVWADANEDRILFTDGNYLKSIVVGSNSVATIAGTGATGFATGPGATTVVEPNYIAVVNGYLLFTSNSNNRIAAVDFNSPTNDIYNLVGGVGTGLVEGDGSTAQVQNVQGIVLSPLHVDAAFVADGQVVRLLTLQASRTISLVPTPTLVPRTATATVMPAVPRTATATVVPVVVSPASSSAATSSTGGASSSAPAAPASSSSPGASGSPATSGSPVTSGSPASSSNTNAMSTPSSASSSASTPPQQSSSSSPQEEGASSVPAPSSGTTSSSPSSSLFTAGAERHSVTIVFAAAIAALCFIVAA